MANLKINKGGEPKAASPSEEIIRTATQGVMINDATGRSIHLRKPGPLAQFRLVEAAGVSAENRIYMSMALPLIYVASIDGSPVPPIQTKSQLEALIQRLDESIELIANAVHENFGASPDPEADKVKLKN